VASPLLIDVVIARVSLTFCFTFASSFCFTFASSLARVHDHQNFALIWNEYLGIAADGLDYLELGAGGTKDPPKCSSRDTTCSTVCSNNHKRRSSNSGENMR
jgi:hypothetical protein